MKNIIMISPPAAGKGTQSFLISSKYNIPHISLGAIFRTIVTENHPQAEYIKKQMETGQLVNDDITKQLLEERISQEDCNNGYIIDGFPRNLEQAKQYEEILKKLDKDLGLVILLDLPKEVSKTRTIGRLSCSCGSVYNEFYEATKPKVAGICDKCGLKLNKRSDDSPETFEQRYVTYINQTQPLIDYYEKKGVLYYVNSGINSEHTFNQIEKIIGDNV